jgi:hypothetical protein
LPLENDLKNERRKEKQRKEASWEEFQRQKVQGVSISSKTRMNKYALVGAILASSNSVLVGLLDIKILALEFGSPVFILGC